MGEFKNNKKHKGYTLNKDTGIDKNGNLISGKGDNPFLDKELADMGGIVNDVTPEDNINDVISDEIKNVTALNPGTNNMDIRCDKIAGTNYEGIVSGLSDNVGGSPDTTESEIKSSLDNAVNDYTGSIVEYSQYLEGSPTFVSYYQIDRKRSTIDTSLGGIVETIGADSPIVYNKIMNFPIWNLEEIIATYSYDEFTGLDTDVQTTGIILPNTIKPRPDEFVLIKYGEREIALKVNNVETTNIFAAVFYRVTLVDDSAKSEALDAQVGSTLYFDYDSGTIKDSATNEILTALNAILNDIEITYINTFFNKYYNSFIFNSCYDKFLHKFIHDTHLFIHEKTFMKDIHVEPTIPFSISEATMYDNSVFERIISCRDKNFIKDVHILPVCNRNNIYNAFNMGRIRIKDIIHCHSGEISIFNEVKTPTERIINNYLSTQNLDYTMYISDLKNLKVQYYLKDYIQLPLVIYVLRQIISNLTKNN